MKFIEYPQENPQFPPDRGTKTRSFEALAPFATSESLEDEAKLSPTEVVARSRDSPAPASMPGAHGPGPGHAMGPWGHGHGSYGGPLFVLYGEYGHAKLEKSDNDTAANQSWPSESKAAWDVSSDE